MCRIDAPFGNLSLDEKKDPTERFLQALDESKADGNFRKLMIKHFAQDWLCVFRSATALESALSEASRHDSESEKCMAVLVSQKDSINKSIMHYLQVYLLPVKNDALIGFLNDVAKIYFPNSAYGLFSCGLNEAIDNYHTFVSWLYGENYSLSKEFFNDEALWSLSEDGRAKVLWDCFNSISPIYRQLALSGNKSSLLIELSSLIASDTIVESQSNTLLELSQGIEFIKSWLKFDAEVGRVNFDLNEFIYGRRSPWGDIEHIIINDKTAGKDVIESCKMILDGFEDEFKCALYINADLSNASCSDIRKWGIGIDRYVNYFPKDVDFSASGIGHLNAARSIRRDDVCAQLTSFQLDTWIRWSVREDFEHVLSSEHDCPEFCRFSEQWLCDDYYDSWELLFLECLNELEIKNRMKVLSSRTPVQLGCNEEINSRCLNLWREQLTRLVKLEHFPKKLIPSWTISAKSRLESEIYLPYIDKSIGILRGVLSEGNASEEELNRYNKQLVELFGVLDIQLPIKALGHRLLLMRSSSIAFADNSVSVRGKFNQELAVKWYSSLTALVENQFAYQVNSKRIATPENFVQVENDFYVNFCHELAEFCLSRLRLRKGQKAKDGKYDSSQVVEQSPTWRQGYLKALIELGVDLNGNVHKTVNFTKKSDPEKDVRDIASECYKAARRHAKKSPTTQDMKRSIVAAEWWLLMCQRHDLGLDVVYEEALKTRRNLMRNP